MQIIEKDKVVGRFKGLAFSIYPQTFTKREFGEEISYEERMLCKNLSQGNKDLYLCVNNCNVNY